ncbi:MAG: regulatory protein RecX [Ruminococcus sp.]|nr:regulatory protein RecX [Ruminococcus sp.]MBQ8905757.1 regulatory protein RecX [Ruminococcus sp.]
MKLTAVKPYKGTTIAVETDTEQTFYFHRDIIGDFGLRTGLELTEEKLEEICEAAEFRRAYQRALYLLDLRAHTYYELFQKLSKHYPREICRKVCDRLSELQIINDRACAQSYARQFVEIKKYGLRRAAMELRHRGLSEVLIQDALAPYHDNVDERLSDVLKKKYARRLTDPTDRAEIEKVKAALVRRGYGFSEINSAIKAYFEEWEE